MEKSNKIVDIIKKPKVIVFSVTVLIVIFLICNILINRPENAVKSFISDCNSVNVYELYEQVDWAGIYVWYDTDVEELGEDFEGFWDKYKEVQNSSEYKEFKKQLDITFENKNDEIEDYFQENEIKLEIKNINKIDKANKNIYIEDVRIQATVNGKKDTYTDEIIIIKRGLKYYLISGEIVESALTDYLIDATEQEIFANFKNANIEIVSEYEKIISKIKSLKEDYDKAEAQYEKKAIAKKIDLLEKDYTNAYNNLKNITRNSGRIVTKVLEAELKAFDEEDYFGLDKSIDWTRLGKNGLDIETIFKHISEEIEKNGKMSDESKTKILELYNLVKENGTSAWMEELAQLLENAGIEIDGIEKEIASKKLQEMIDSIDED